MSTVLKIDEVGTVITGKTPKTSVSEFWDGNLPFYTPSDMDGRRRLDGVKRYITEEGLKSVKNSVIPPNSVMVSCIGSDMGKVSLSVHHGVTNQQINTIIPNEEVVDFLYLYYSLLPRKSELQMLASGGSAQPILNKGQFSQFEVVIPSLQDQKAIAHILGTLDDKIELNQKMNQTLEDIAKAIFKSWFVDFDPVRAKAEGRPTGLPSEISDLFPDELVDLLIGEVPKGWNLASIDEACEKVYTGGTPSTKVPEYWGGSHGWLSSGETGSAFIIDTEKKITEAGIENSSTKAALRFDTVIASAGQGKTRGQTSLLLLNTYVNQSVVTLRAKTEIGALLLFFNLSRRYEEFRRYSDSSSSRGSLTTTLLKELPFVIPTERLTIVFHKAILPMVEKIELNLREILVLSELRDTLLPKLISGELRISDAEKFLKKAGL
ncbi:restriction endonuclease subunit S [Planktomarina temperata]|nr:restriction endonuclease subunit S [Planktomarina temperata]